MLKNYLLFLLILTLLTSLAFQYCFGKCSLEEDFQTLDPVDLPDSSTYRPSGIDPLMIPASGVFAGYYQYSDLSMIKYPTTQRDNKVTLYPLTSQYESLLADGYYRVAIGGTDYLAQLPNGYYQVSSTKMARLPTNGMVSPIPERGYTIPSNYYPIKINPNTLEEDSSQPEKNYIAPIPYGYMYDYGTGGLKEKSIVSAYAQFAAESGRGTQGGYQYTARDISYNLSAAKDTRTKYDALNTNVEYHDSVDTITGKTNDIGLGFGDMLVTNQNGELVNVPYVPGQALPVYYKPGSYLYDVKYIPNYEDSVYLSRTTGLPSYAKAYPTTNMMGGFCNSLKNDKTALELKCNSIKPDQCASTDCCVLFGGTKCVAGDEKGPTFKANYTDLYVTNRDSYYYKGLCYGNCQ